VNAHFESLKAELDAQAEAKVQELQAELDLVLDQTKAAEQEVEAQEIFIKSLLRSKEAHFQKELL